MKAAVFHGIGDIRLDEVAEPKIEKPSDALVRLTAIVGVYPQIGEGVSHWPGDAQKPHPQDGQLQSPQIHPEAARDGARGGTADLERFLTQREEFDSVLDAYRAFDSRQPGWIKVHLVPRAAVRPETGAEEPALHS